MRLRQVALVAEDLSANHELLTEVLGLGAGFHDPGIVEFGLENVVLPIGDTFLEVVSPAREGTTAGRLLARRGGDGGYMVIVQSQDHEDDRARVDQLGIRIVWQVSLPDASAMHLHPRDVGGAILSLDRMDPEASWKWGGPKWEANVDSQRCREIVGVELQAEDPATMATRWAETCGLKASQEAADAWRLDFDEGGFARFHGPRDERGEGVVGVILRTADGGEAAIRKSAESQACVDDAGEIRLCGTRVGFE